MFHFGAKSRTTPGGVIRINCPNCHGREVEARMADVEEITTVMFIPVWRSHFTLAKCVSCGIVLRARKPAPEIAGLTPAQLESVLAIRGDFVGAFMAVAGVLLSPMPLLGSVLALVAILMTRKSPIWVRRVARISLFSSIAWLVLLAGVFAYRWQQGMLGSK